MFGKGGLGGLMKQAQQMQEKMQKMQEEIAQLEVTGESGAGLVKITINGAHNCRRIEIDPSLMEDDKEMLEDLIAAAFNECGTSCRRITKRKNGIGYCWNAITSRNEVSVLIIRRVNIKFTRHLLFTSH